MKHIFIVNPTSGNGFAKNAIPLIKKIGDTKSLDYTILLTEYPGHARELAALYSIRENACLYSVGGDGTAYEILNGLSDRVPMAIIPCGTGNDFYRIIVETIPSSLEERILETIEGRIVEVDYGLSNHTRFLNCTTLGFDAEINHLVNTTMKKTHLPANLMYLTAALSKLVNPPCHSIRLVIDGQLLEQKVLLAAMMNGRFYGGGFNPTPQADIQDGFFDLCLVEPMPRRRILQLIGKYMKGQHTHFKECKILRGRHIIIDSDQPIVMQSDGEDFRDLHITLDLMRSALRLKVPQRSLLK